MTDSFLESRGSDPSEREAYDRQLPGSRGSDPSERDTESETHDSGVGDTIWIHKIDFHFLFTKKMLGTKSE